MSTSLSQRLLFVCLGNICRSPAAEGVMRSVIQQAGLAGQIEVASAGTLDYHTGALPDERMRAAAGRRGYRLESRARQIAREDFSRFDLILTMDARNLRVVQDLAESDGERAKVVPFCNFCSRFSDTEVPDPYYGGAEGFEHVLDLLEDGCKGLLEHLHLARIGPCVPQARTIEYDWMSVATWQALHASHVAQAAKGDVDLLLLGDSITQGWQGTQAGAELFGPYRTANFGIGGDATQNVLWRLEHGTIGKLQPRLVLLLIGVNNLGREENSPEQTLAGIAAIIAKIHQVFPMTRVLLHAILPADASAESAFRKRIQATNTQLAAWARGQELRYFDASHALLSEDGSLRADLVPDGLHPNEAGYARWARELKPVLERCYSGSLIS